ncbi:MAG: response regulator [Candidatus Eisenbacteria bacterium]|nr:response regulator [Candidatus Eisenbacteria bacterium]
MAEAGAKVLVVDDESYVRDIICRKLSRESYECDQAENAEKALALITQGSYECILSDINMPGMDGIELLRNIRVADSDVAVIMVTGAPDLDGALEAMRLGAYDHLCKPLNLDQLSLTVERAIEKKRLVEENREYQRNLESKVQERTKQLHEANEELRRLFMGSIKALAQALEAKDEYTQGHSERVSEIAIGIGRYLSLSEKDISDIWLAGLLHDIGKIGVREAVLNKPGKLNDEEWKSIQNHPVMAERILCPIEELTAVISIVRHHHERFDGSGYPDGLSGSDIPLGARILTVADAYDALTSRRPYRDALSVEDALSVLEDASGTQFDPVIVRAFLSSTELHKLATEKPDRCAEPDSVHDAKQGHGAPAGTLLLKPTDLS